MTQHLDHAVEILGLLSIEDLLKAVLVDDSGVDAVEAVLHALRQFRR